ELIKRLHDKILKSIDEIMRVTTTFLKAGVADFSREQKKSLPLWKQQEAGQKQNFKKGGFQNQQRSEQKQDSDFISILGEEEGMEGLTTIKAEMGGHFVCHMCVDGGSTSEILYEYYFNRFHPEQDYSARMHNGLRTKSIAAHNRSSYRRKDSVAIHPEYPKQAVAIGSTLTEEGQKELCDLLRRNLDVFSW
nr:reverse transcriptase domain-containing protein [Tanacetum cinerariifolium]